MKIVIRAPVVFSLWVASGNKSDLQYECLEVPGTQRGSYIVACSDSNHSSPSAVAKGSQSLLLRGSNPAFSLVQILVQRGIQPI